MRRTALGGHPGAIICYMATREEIKAQIRFHLSELGRLNRHHEFERLCMDLARERICGRVIPATGPVAAGGDQGRDFETFRSFLGASPLRASTFLGLVREGVLVFACTTQVKGLATKIRSDARKILAQGTRPTAVYFFLTSDLPAAQRHKLQTAIKKEQEVGLEILDLQAIAELLSDPDVFWIASEHLRIAAELYPVRTEAEAGQWYPRVRQRWREDPPAAPLSVASFGELKAATRRAVAVEALRPDLAEWITWLHHVAESHPSPWLRRSALYEALVARLRGQGTLLGREEFVRAYYAQSLPPGSDKDLEDLVNLLMYVFGARQRAVLDVAEDELHTWAGAVRAYVVARLADTPASSHNARCLLLDVAARLEVWQATVWASHGAAVDLQPALAAWQLMVDLIPRAPLFPLERFAKYLAQVDDLLPEHRVLRELLDCVDRLVAARFGEFRAAELARERAVRALDKGKLLRVIGELHRAKVQWFARETLELSVGMMLVIADVYLALRLPIAAKHYALAAAYLASQVTDPKILALVPRGVLLAADAEYAAGAWLGALALMDTGADLHANIVAHAEDAHTDVGERLALHTLMIVVLGERLLPAAAVRARALLDAWGLGGDVERLLPEARRTWGGPLDEVWEPITQQLLGRPFGDTARYREIAWNALGITWVVRFANTYAGTAAAEEWVALAQITSSDLAGPELQLLPSRVDVDVVVEGTGPPRCEGAEFRDGARRWQLFLPEIPPTSRLARERHDRFHMATVMQIVREVSLLPAKHFDEVIEGLFRGGIPAKVFVARPYGELYREFVPEAQFDAGSRQEVEPPEHARDFGVTAHPELEWRSSPLPDHTSEGVAQVIERRYERARLPVHQTLTRLVAHAVFRDAVTTLRGEGWRDWHILMAVSGVATNYRGHAVVPDDAPQAAWSAEMNRLMRESESDASVPVPLELFTADRLRNQIRMNMLVSVRQDGFEVYHEAVDMAAVERFVLARFRYLDDVPHQDPFVPEGHD